jgi:arylsulfatase A-like enzyme
MDAASHKSLRVLYLSSLFFALPLAGCSVTTGRIDLNLGQHVRLPQRAVVLFLVDGLDSRRMEELIAQGRMPNIARRFMAEGVCVENAVSSMPAITYPNLVSLVTGVFPGHHGIVGNQWYDRDDALIRDYMTTSTYLTAEADFSRPTIYEILGDRFTANIQCPVRRGAKRTADNTVLTGLDWFFDTCVLVDARVGSDLGWAAATANEAGHWPTLLMHYFPAVDEIGHRYGRLSTPYTTALINIDRQIGRVMDAIDKSPLAGRTSFVLTSDHGHVMIGPDRICDIGGYLRHHGLRVRDSIVTTGDRDHRDGELGQVDAVINTGAFRRCLIYLRGAGGWSDAPSPVQIDAIVGMGRQSASRLVDQPGIAVICVRAGSDAVRICTRSGTAIVERRLHEGTKQYRIYADHPDSSLEPDSVAMVESGAVGDPLGYSEDPGLTSFISAGWHASREWLCQTAKTRFPDFVPQIVEMFDSRRSGDIVLFADEDWSFSQNGSGGHGSALWTDMRIPMLFAGAGIARGQSIPAARLVDVAPTVLDLIGESAMLDGRVEFDGVSLAAQLRGINGTCERGPG